PPRAGSCSSPGTRRPRSTTSSFARAACPCSPSPSPSPTWSGRCSGPSRWPDRSLAVPRNELSPQRYRDLVEQSGGLICTHDLAGVLLSVNRAAAERLGYAPEELVGRSLGDLLAPAVRHLFPQYLDRIQRHATDEGLMLMVARDGDERIWTYSNV